jgi:pyruvate dehydrogenase (quinone)
MIDTKAVYNAVMGCDLLLMVGTDYPYSNFLPSNGTIVQVDERPASAWAARGQPCTASPVRLARPLRCCLTRSPPRTTPAFGTR